MRWARCPNRSAASCCCGSSTASRLPTSRPSWLCRSAPSSRGCTRHWRRCAPIRRRGAGSSADGAAAGHAGEFAAGPNLRAAAELNASMDPRDPLDDELPPALQRDLRRLFGPAPRIPPSIGDALQRAARRELRPRPIRRLRPWLVAAGAAAALLLVRRQRLPPTAGEDFDGNGRIDVLDAYRLALALQRGDAVPARCDLDGDGRVDRRDVDAIAARAVRVHG